MSYRVAILTLSDKGARGERTDESGPAIAEMVRSAGYEVVYQNLMSDELEPMKKELARLCDENVCDLLLTTGGTGFSRRDVTPEATEAVINRVAPGIPEAMRLAAMRTSPNAMLSRGIAGLRGGTLIINLPGSTVPATSSLEAILPSLKPGIDRLRRKD